MPNLSKLEKSWKTLRQEGFIEVARKFFRYIKKIRYDSKKIKLDDKLSIKNYYENHRRFNTVARPHKIIWVRPEDIQLYLKDDRFKRKRHVAGKILDGNWDLNINTIEHQREKLGKWLTAHFKDGVPWEDTGLFQNNYARKFEGGDWVYNDCRSLQELVNYYNDKIDGLYYSLKENGFLLPSKDRPEIDFVYVHIGRGGELIGTQGGRHRLFIAMDLNIKSIPVRVWLRHKNWQEIREKLSADRGQWGENWVKPYLNHPDLEDIFAAKN